MTKDGEPGLDGATAVVLAPQHISADIGDEVAILNTESGVYFGLAGTGVRVWELLRSPISVDDLSARLLLEFEADPEVLRTDVTDLVSDLLRQGLVTIAPFLTQPVLRGILGFARAPAVERRWFVRALGWVVLTRGALSLLAYPRAHHLVWCPVAPQTPEPGAEVEVATAIRRASRMVPGATCLVQALAGGRLLRARGVEAQLCIGAARQADKFAAHAWVEVAGLPVIGAEERKSFMRLTS